MIKVIPSQSIEAESIIKGLVKSHVYQAWQWPAQIGSKQETKRLDQKIWMTRMTLVPKEVALVDQGKV